MKNKKVIIIGAFVIFLIFITFKIILYTWAEEKSTNAINLKVPVKQDFSDITSSTSDQYNTAVLGPIDFAIDKDNVGRINLTMSASHFYDSDEYIDVANLTVRPANLTVKKGGFGLHYLGPTHTFMAETDSTLIFSTIEGRGKSEYSFDIDLSLKIPPNTSIGNYTSTLILTTQ